MIRVSGYRRASHAVRPLGEDIGGYDPICVEVPVVMLRRHRVRPDDGGCGHSEIGDRAKTYPPVERSRRGQYEVPRARRRSLLQCRLGELISVQRDFHESTYPIFKERVQVPMCLFDQGLIVATEIQDVLLDVVGRLTPSALHKCLEGPLRVILAFQEAPDVESRGSVQGPEFLPDGLEGEGSEDFRVSELLVLLQFLLTQLEECPPADDHGILANDLDVACLEVYLVVIGLVDQDVVETGGEEIDQGFVLAPHDEALEPWNGRLVENLDVLWRRDMSVVKRRRGLLYGCYLPRSGSPLVDRRYI